MKEDLLIRSVSSLNDVRVPSKNLVGRLFGGIARLAGEDVLEGGSFPDAVDGGKANLEGIPEENQMVTVVRGYNDTDPLAIEDEAEVINKSRYLYTIRTAQRHRLLRGDKITISGSKHEELNGEHTVVDNNDVYLIVIYVDKFYEQEDTISPIPPVVSLLKVLLLM